MRQNSEYWRKLIHLFNAVVPVAYLTIFPEKFVFLKILGIFTVVFLVVDIGRMRVKFLQKIFQVFLNGMLRGHELEGKFTGATWVMIGNFITILIFPKPVAILSIFFLVFGDTAAALIGMRFGHHKIWGKSWEGFFGGVAVSVCVAWIYPSVPFSIGFAGAVSGMIMELVPIPLDDNFKIPLGAGAIMMMLSTPLA